MSGKVYKVPEDMIPLKKAISKSLNHVIRGICGRKKTRELFNIVNDPQFPCPPLPHLGGFLKWI